MHPIRLLVGWCFRGEFDGLEDAVTAKAAQQFVGVLLSSQKRNSAVGTNTSASPAEATKEAINRAWSAVGFSSTKDEAIRSNSLLVVYLHAPLHRSTPGAIEKLVSPEVSEFLNQPYVKALGVSIHTAQGASLASMLGAVSYPLLAVLQPQSSTTMNLVCLAQGGEVWDNLTVTRLVQALDACRQRHMVAVNEAERRRLQREQEAELRRQQDAEYHQALEADRERERQQREAQEAEERRQEEEARIEREAAAAEMRKLQSARDLLRDEPTSGGCMIRFQLPSGTKVNRRFAADETIGSLQAFLHVHFKENAIAIEHAGLSTNFPRRTYTDESQTLQEAGLVPQAVIMVQDLDA